MLAADFVMVPLQAEDFGAQGITHIQRAIDLAMEKYNPKLRMLGYLVTLRQRLAIHDVYEMRLRSLYGPTSSIRLPVRGRISRRLSPSGCPSTSSGRAAAAAEGRERHRRGDPAPGPRGTAEAARVPPTSRIASWTGNIVRRWRHEPSRAARRAARAEHEREPRRPGPSRQRARHGAGRPIAGESPEDGRTRDRQAGHMELDRIIPDPDQPRKFFDRGVPRAARPEPKDRGPAPADPRPVEQAEHGKWVII